MTELLTAIFARFNAAEGEALRALVVGMYFSKAPQGTTGKYITVSYPGGSVDSVMPNADHDLFNITFSIWDTASTPADVLLISDALCALYDNVILTLSTKTVVYANRIAGNLVEDPDKGWAKHVQYEYRVG